MKGMTINNGPAGVLREPLFALRQKIILLLQGCRAVPPAYYISPYESS
jgi:hypothetical protein